MVDDVRRVGDSVDVVCFEFCVLPTALLLERTTNLCLREQSESVYVVVWLLKIVESLVVRYVFIRIRM